MVKEIKNNRFYFDGVDTVGLAKKYGTPLYVYSKSDMVARMRECKESFTQKYENTRIAYAAKAFLTKGMAKIVDEEGLCMDVVSAGELYVALSAGFPAEKIEFNGNNKLYSELELAVKNDVGRIIVDGKNELEMIEKICIENNKTANIMFRVTPGVAADSHDYIVTGKKDSKFGFVLEPETVFPLVKMAMESEHIEFYGFHFHVGSQLFENEVYLRALDKVFELIENLKRDMNVEIKELNVGGGFGINYTKNDDRKPYSFFLDPIMDKINNFFEKLGQKRPHVVIEPGRSIVGEGGITLYTIGSIKEIKGVRTYAAVDGGMADNIRPALYGSVYEGIIANKAEEKMKDIVTICGKCCESGDIIIKDFEVPKLEEGDTLAVYSTGAYGHAMASNYNKLPVPAVVLVSGGKDSLMTKRQTYEDLIMNDMG